MIIDVFFWFEFKENKKEKRKEPNCEKINYDAAATVQHGTARRLPPRLSLLLSPSLPVNLPTKFWRDNRIRRTPESSTLSADRFLPEQLLAASNHPGTRKEANKPWPFRNGNSLIHWDVGVISCICARRILVNFVGIGTMKAMETLQDLIEEAKVRTLYWALCVFAVCYFLSRECFVFILKFFLW